MKTGWIALMLLAGLGPACAQQYTISTFSGGTPPATPVAALGTSIGAPRRLALDPAGNVYFSSLNSVFKMDTTGVLTLIAGNARPGYTGDGGAATAAELNGPQGVAVDPSGNIYIADTINSVVRMVTPAGIISTFAGSGAPGYAGDYGQANMAQLTMPSGLAFDTSGNLYIADAGNNVIRQVDTYGTITTVAGNSFQGYTGDAGLATGAALNIPTDVAVDSKGNIYIADTGNNVVRQVLSSNGFINTIAGGILDVATSTASTTVPNLGDGLAATGSILNAPRGVAVDSAGNVYISDYGDYRVRKATPNSLAPTITQNTDGTSTFTYNSNSIINTLAGTSTPGFAGDGSAGTSAELAGPWGIALDGSGNVYVSDVYNNRIRKLTASGNNISTIAGNGLLSFSGDGSAAAMAQLNAPRSVVVDAAGNLYIADANNNRVRKVSPGGVISTVAGNGTAGFGGDGSPATSAQINQPAALAVDHSGNLYIADFVNNRVRMVNSAGIISTVAGSGTEGFSGDGGSATSAALNGPTALAVDQSGNVYVSDFTNNRVRKFVPGGSISTVAGNGQGGFGGDGGPSINAALNGPYGLAVDGSGNLYIADLNNSRIRQVSSSGTIITISGSGLAMVSGDGGPAWQAQLAAPQSLLLDSVGDLYIGDSYGRVRMIAAQSGIISTVAGRGPAGYTGDGGMATSALINGPLGLALDAAGNVYIADTFNNAIRQMQPAGGPISLNAITNGASNASGPMAPGELVTLYGTGLGPMTLTQFAVSSSGTVPTNLAGTRVTVNGMPAPILYTWANQVGVMVPFGVTGNTAQVVAQFGSQTSAPLTVPVTASSPALFTADYSGKGQAVVNNQNGTRNSAATPAPAGSTITLVATGGGVTIPPSSDGAIGSNAASSQLAEAVTLTIGGQSATVSYAGTAPGIVAGITQINATIPSGVAVGNAVPVVLNVGGIGGPGVTIAVSAAAGN